LQEVNSITYDTLSVVRLTLIGILAFSLIGLVKQHGENKAGSYLIQSMASIENQESDHNLIIYPLYSEPYGMTYSQLSQKWWQWILSTPADINPLLDDTGEHCAQGQDGPVWFLAGTLGGRADRTCTIPEGKAIFFPVLNNLNVRTSPSETEKVLLDSLRPSIDRTTTLEVTIDGVPLQDLKNYRVQSSLFDVTLPENNLLGVPPMSSEAVSDGYWVLLKSLPAGDYSVYIHGRSVDATITGAPTDNIVTEAIYKISIVKADSNNDGDQVDVGSNELPIILRGTSASGKYDVEIGWMPNDIGQDNSFNLRFFDAENQTEISGATYSIMLFRGDRHLAESHRDQQTSTYQTYRFDQEGSYILRLENINDNGIQDGIDIPIMVTPEFPVGAFGVMTIVTMAVIIGSVILAARRRLA
jgi:hypothetical protein